MPARKYAETTTVTPDKSLGDIRAVLSRYGANGFALFEQADRIGIGFEMQQRRVRFTAKLPSRKAFEQTPERRLTRTPAAAQTAYEQAVRQVWRALHLVIKSKLESVASGIETFEEAFQAQIVLPTGQTVGEWIAPQIAVAYDRGTMPPLLEG